MPRPTNKHLQAAAAQPALSPPALPSTCNLSFAYPFTPPNRWLVSLITRANSSLRCAPYIRELSRSKSGWARERGKGGKEESCGSPKRNLKGAN
eukprot:1239383-Pleurochrysis_carterae.AAC.1